MFKKRSAVAFFAVVATTAAFAPAVWAQSVYVVGSPGANPTAPFGTLDIATGAFTALGTVNRQFATLAFAPDGALYGTDFSRNLYRINTANGATTFIGSTGTTFLIGLAATGNGTVFGMTNAAPSGQLYTVDTTTAALTVRGGSFGNAPDKGDNLEFGLGGTLYAAGDDAQGRFALYAANALTGAGTLIGGDTAFFDVRGLTWTG